MLWITPEHASCPASMRMNGDIRFARYSSSSFSHWIATILTPSFSYWSCSRIQECKNRASSSPALCLWDDTRFPPAVRFDPRKGKDAMRIADMVTAWADVSAKYRNGDMSRDDYDTWRYSYPAHDETQNYVKMPSHALSDALVEAFKDKL